MQHLLVERIGHAGHIRLDRPEALNALTLEMVQGMRETLATWAEDATVHAVVVSGAGERAFCAGGDVKAAWQAGSAGELGPGSLTDRFFREEYQLNHEIANYPKPYVAWLDGLTMGGGVGISILGSHRVASKRLRFAMPETAIGFFPDVGASYFLSRLGPVGTLLATTGITVEADAALGLGLATHQWPHDEGDDLLRALSKQPVEEVLAGRTGRLGGGEAARWSDLATRCFDSFDANTIVSALETEAAQGSATAEQTLATLRQRSPTSVCLALRLLSQGRHQSLRQCLAMEFRASQALLRGHDFYEGVRAQLVDKDHTPRWQPASLGEVAEGQMEACLAPLGDAELWGPEP